MMECGKDIGFNNQFDNGLEVWFLGIRSRVTLCMLICNNLPLLEWHVRFSGYWSTVVHVNRHSAGSQKSKRDWAMSKLSPESSPLSNPISRVHVLYCPSLAHFCSWLTPLISIPVPPHRMGILHSWLHPTMATPTWWVSFSRLEPLSTPLVR